MNIRNKVLLFITLLMTIELIYYPITNVLMSFLFQRFNNPVFQSSFSELNKFSRVSILLIEFLSVLYLTRLGFLHDYKVAAFKFLIIASLLVLTLLSFLTLYLSLFLSIGF